MNFIVTIDGPAGAGKTFTAKESARVLGMLYLDTGAMYRSVALYMLNNHIDIMSEDVIPALNEIKISFDNDRNIFLNNMNVSDEIRTEKVSQGASRVSTIKEVRSFLVKQQREIGNISDIVAEGRDMGTIVFPNAQVKFFLECSIDERTRRRYNDYLKKGIDIDYDKLKAEIISRDQRDTTRQYAPLRKADDAILIDTTKLSKEDQISFVIEKAEAIRKNLQHRS